MNFAAIVPTRDRPKCFANCKRQLDRQTLQPDNRYYMAFDPQSSDMDLVKRVRNGVELARKDGMDIVMIVEDDDSYPDDYFERFQPFFKDYEFFGDDSTTYYHLKNKTYRTWYHPNRASLFTTGFKISALNLFEWPADNEKFLDIRLWDYARRRKKKFVDTGAIGIKGHGEGKTGGKGHIMRLTNLDKDLSFLKSKVNGSFEFYENIIKGL
jgi:hypothetical protein